MESTADLDIVDDGACGCAFGGQRLTEAGFFNCSPSALWRQGLSVNRKFPTVAEWLQGLLYLKPPMDTQVHHADTTHTGTRQRG